jgi:hypothetical protein
LIRSRKRAEPTKDSASKMSVRGAFRISIRHAGDGRAADAERDRLPLSSEFASTYWSRLDHGHEQEFQAMSKMTDSVPTMKKMANRSGRLRTSR